MTTNSQNLPSAIKQRSELDKFLDRSFVWLTRIFALAIAGTLLWITLQVAIGAWPAIREFGLGFLAKSSWNPVNNEYGVLPQVYGTLVSSFLGLLLAVPIGVGTAVLLSEDFLPSKVRIVLVFLVELLAAIPSVVYGVWGIFVLVPMITSLGNWLHTYLGKVPFFSTPPTGPGMLSAGVILAIMTDRKSVV